MIVDIVKLASKNRMTLTKAIREKMGLDVGDILAFIEYEDHFGILKLDEEKILTHHPFK